MLIPGSNHAAHVLVIYSEHFQPSFDHKGATFMIDRSSDRQITGSTVVLTCCKGDSQSRWKTPNFWPILYYRQFDNLIRYARAC